MVMYYLLEETYQWDNALWQKILLEYERIYSMEKVKHHFFCTVHIKKNSERPRLIVVSSILLNTLKIKLLVEIFGGCLFN